MSFGILQSGSGRAVSDGVLGATMASGPGRSQRDGVLGAVMASGAGYRPYNAGVLGEYFESGTSGLGCACRGVGETDDVGVPTSLILGVAIGLGIAYLFPTIVGAPAR